METRTAGSQFLAGALAALVTAVGLVRFGAAPFQLLRDALVWRGGDTVPFSLQQGGSAALCSLLFGAATLIALLGLLRLGRVTAFSSLALILVIASGAANAVGGAGLCLGASRELAACRVLALSARAPQEDELDAVLEDAMEPVRVGFAGLLAATVLLLVLSCGRPQPGECVVASRGAAPVVGGLAAASVVAFALALAATWFPMRSLAAWFESPGLLRPDEFVLLVSRTIQLCMLAGILLLLHGVLVVLFGILLRRAASQMPSS